MKTHRFAIAVRRWLALALTAPAVVFLMASAPAPAPLPGLNEKVLAFARTSLGTSVGDGSCTSLAIAALKEAGARPFPEDPGDGDYVWGEPVESFKAALPGDILQFHNAVFQGKKFLSPRRWTSWHQEYPHHTAIVSRVKPGAKVVVIVHQNVTIKGKDGKETKNVQETEVPVDSLQKGGWVHIFRPVPARTRATAPGDESEAGPRP
jgi:hypothetical protein